MSCSIAKLRPPAEVTFHYVHLRGQDERFAERAERSYGLRILTAAAAPANDSRATPTRKGDRPPVVGSGLSGMLTMPSSLAY
jgi:hypothetical protein